jgi:hypothetical protein
MDCSEFTICSFNCHLGLDSYTPCHGVIYLYVLYSSCNTDLNMFLVPRFIFCLEKTLAVYFFREY